MFGLSSIKLISIALGALFIVGVVFGGYEYVKGLETRLVTAEKDASTANAAFVTEHATSEGLKKQIDGLNDQMTKMQETVKQTLIAYQANARDVQKLRDEFAKHNLERLTNAKPGLLEDIINRGTLRVWDGLQCAGGSTTKCPPSTKASANRPSAGSSAVGSSSPSR